MVSFGQWLKSKREKSGQKLTEFANRTGVDASTLSRIENERTQATIETAIRICEGIGVELSQLIADLVGSEVIQNLKQQQTDIELLPDLLKLEDVVKFFTYCEHHFDAGIILLGKLLDMAAERERLLRGIHDESVYDADAIHRILLPDPMYVVEVAYPSDFGAVRVLQTYHSGGVLTFSDVGIYLRGQRAASKRTLASMEAASKRSASVLSRLEGGELGRVKLQTALNLNKELGDTNEILGMFWAASHYHAAARGQVEFSENDDPVTYQQLGEILVTFCRWLQLQDPSASWLREIREELKRVDSL